jgi:hypothetical protein
MERRCGWIGMNVANEEYGCGKIVSGLVWPNGGGMHIGRDECG